MEDFHVQMSAFGKTVVHHNMLGVVAYMENQQLGYRNEHYLYN